jgi:hypothetical protein
MNAFRAVIFLVIALPVIAEAWANDPTFESINAAFGAELLSDENLWDDNAEAVAHRLSLPSESKTSNDSSFRKYPSSDERIFDCRPYSCALLAEDGLPSSFSLVFANKGDAVTLTTSKSDRKQMRLKADQIRDLQPSIRADQKQITKTLTNLFGEPVADRFGQGRETRENVKRWDWKGHAFLLAAPREEYVALRIMPTEAADIGGKSRITDTEIRKRVATRVDSRPNGDVILKDIPMVNQGLKGYCVPATWERVMRYMGIPADMYVLAMAGQTKEGGGSSIDKIARGAKESIVRSGRKVEKASIKLGPVHVSRYIDRGLPIMWTMYSTEEFNTAANSRAELRRKISLDSDEWKKALSEARKNSQKFKIDLDTGHVCMIVGYNKETEELAVSDSFGPEFAERWVTTEEAAAISADCFNIIDF